MLMTAAVVDGRSGRDQRRGQTTAAKARKHRLSAQASTWRQETECTSVTRVAAEMVQCPLAAWDRARTVAKTGTLLEVTAVVRVQRAVRVRTPYARRRARAGSLTRLRAMARRTGAHPSQTRLSGLLLINSISWPTSGKGVCRQGREAAAAARALVRLAGRLARPQTRRGIGTGL